MSEIKKVSKLSDDIVQGTAKCFVCKNEYEYVAIVKGNRSVESVNAVFQDKTATDNVIVTESFAANNGKAGAVRLEIVVKCPNCGAKNRTKNTFKTWEASE